MQTPIQTNGLAGWVVESAARDDDDTDALHDRGLLGPHRVGGYVMAAARPLTLAMVAAVQAVLSRQGIPVTVAALRQYLGAGDTRALQRHLNTLARQGALHTSAATEARQAVLPPGGPTPRRQDVQAHQRAVEATALDGYLATRRAQGYGRVPPPPEGMPDEEDDTPETTAAGRRLKTQRLVRSLLDEAVPWLRARENAPEPEHACARGRG